jgi:hypothetical protein
MSHHLNRQIHFQQSELQAIQRDQAHGRYNGFRNTFDEWETRKERAEDDPFDDDPDDLADSYYRGDRKSEQDEDDEGGEDDIERARSRGGSFGRQLRLGEAA